MTEAQLFGLMFAFGLGVLSTLTAYVKQISRNLEKLEVTLSRVSRRGFFYFCRDCSAFLEDSQTNDHTSRAHAVAAFAGERQ